MDITTKEQLINVIKEQDERIKNLTNSFTDLEKNMLSKPKEPATEEPTTKEPENKEPESKEPTPKEIDEVDKLLSGE